MADSDTGKTIEVFCHYKASEHSYEADVASDICSSEFISGLMQANYLDALRPGERYCVVLCRTGGELSLSEAFDHAGVEDGDTLEIHLESHGAGLTPDIVGGVGGAIAAAKVTVDAYRARTERMTAELARAEFEARAGRDRNGAEQVTDRGDGP